VKDVGAFFYFENEGDEMRCVLCNSEMVYTREENGEPYLYCWYCEEDAKDPDPYVDDSLNEVSMGRFDDDPPEYM
tara:strand:+ start:293 stop:517 length:225 start_codon:yes stop_codon:yes gene_type:complete